MRTVLLTVLVLLSPVLRAATYFVPPDAELIQQADDIVIAVGVTSHAERTGRGGIVTRYTLRIEEVLKGPRAAGQQLVLTERGGRLRGRAQLVAGAPMYEAGERYLVFTSAGADLEPVTLGMSLGRFVLREGVADRGDVSGLDRNLEPHVEVARDAAVFVGEIRRQVARTIGGPPPARPMSPISPIGPMAVPGPTRASYLFEGNFRWQATPDARFVISGTLDGATAAATRGIAEWNATESNIAYALQGQDDTALGGLVEPDGMHGILFGDPNDEIPSNVAASGGAWGGEDYTFEGETFVAIEEADVVFAHPFPGNAACLNTVMTHELGHTLGLRHSNRDGNEKACPAAFDCASDAIMKDAVICQLDGHLRPWDERAAEVVYGAGPPPPCEEPRITAQPESVTVSPGTQVTLSASASGTAPVTLQWYVGPRGDRSQAVGAGAEVIVTPSVTTTYWVRAANACGSALGTEITVTVQTRRRRSVGRS